MPYLAEAAAMIGLSADGVVVTNLFTTAGAAGAEAVWAVCVGVGLGRWSAERPGVGGACGAAGSCVAAGCGTAAGWAAAGRPTNASGKGSASELTTTTGAGLAGAGATIAAGTGGP